MAEKESEMADMKGGASFVRGMTKSSHSDVRSCIIVLWAGPVGCVMGGPHFLL